MSLKQYRTHKYNFNFGTHFNAHLQTNIGQKHRAFICKLLYVVSANWAWCAKLSAHSLRCLSMPPNAELSGGLEGANDCRA